MPAYLPNATCRPGPAPCPPSTDLVGVKLGADSWAGCTLRWGHAERHNKPACWLQEVAGKQKGGGRTLAATALGTRSYFQLQQKIMLGKSPGSFCHTWQLPGHHCYQPTAPAQDIAWTPSSWCVRVCLWMCLCACLSAVLPVACELPLISCVHTMPFARGWEQQTYFSGCPSSRINHTGLTFVSTYVGADRRPRPHTHHNRG